MIKLRSMIIFFALIFSNPSFAGTAIFYQPQLLDMLISKDAWSKTFESVKAKGFDSLVVQWTQYGEIFSQGEQRAWLKDRMTDAIDAGLMLIIGLSADPDVFSRLEQPTTLLADYFRKMTQNDLALAKFWMETLPAEKIMGWYLPLEIDDRRWREAKAFEVLKTHIHDEVDAFKGISVAPVMISTFFTGNMAPQRYAEMLSTLKKSTSLNIWVQDGKGTLKLGEVQRQLYISQLTRCDSPVVDGVIHELFKQISVDTSFKAGPLSQSALMAALKARAPCHGENAFFELRYVWGDGLSR